MARVGLAGLGFMGGTHAQCHAALPNAELAAVCDVEKDRREKFADMVNTSINQTLSRTTLTAGTTWVVALILFLNGGEVIRGFGLAMLIGVLLGTYSSIFVVGSLLVDWVNRDEKKRLERLARKV